MDDEPVAPDALGREEHENENVEQATINEDDLLPNGVGDINAPTTNGAHGNNIIVSSDPTATALAKKGITMGFKEKKIPKDKRSTTPYMTKYERARVLGTRALQIRSELALIDIALDSSQSLDCPFFHPSLTLGTCVCLIEIKYECASLGRSGR